MNAPLTIPDLEEATMRELQAQAAVHGQTPEAEAREVLTLALNQAVAKKAAYDEATANAAKQAFLSVMGCVDGTPDLSSKRGFER